jgi:hypothetical protein
MVLQQMLKKAVRRPLAGSRKLHQCLLVDDGKATLLQ